MGDKEKAIKNWEIALQNVRRARRRTRPVYEKELEDLKEKQADTGAWRPAPRCGPDHAASRQVTGIPLLRNMSAATRPAQRYPMICVAM